MTENTIELTRRKILAGVGAVGAAGAGVGMGTSALFSDEEGFEDNVLTAGTLDLKVDWEEHYSYPQIYGWEDPTSGLSATRSDPGSLDSPVAFPPGVEANDNLDPLLWVDADDVPAYMDATAIEAFPDEDNNRVQDALEEYEACTDFADVPADLDPGGLRTDNADTRTDEEAAAPLVSLSDVKPGDFGEVTLSAHLCDNDGYLWLTAGNVSESENGVTEPEGDSDEEESGTVELLDEIQTAWWYDTNCNNLTDGGRDSTDSADVMVVLDRSGSMSPPVDKFDSAKEGAKSLVEALGSGAEFGLVSFGEGTATLDESLGTTESAFDSSVDGLKALGQTNIDAALDEATAELSANGRANADSIIVLLSNGTPTVGDDPEPAATAFKNGGGTIYGIAYGDGANLGLIQDLSSDPDSDFAFEGEQADIVSVFDDIGRAISGGEEVFFQGDLRTALGALTSGDGIPLDGDGGDDFDEIGGDPTADTRGCFEGGTTNCLGFSWWVPTDVGNQIQSDSVEFDLGFYTEQCRNNDGSGTGGTQTTTSTQATQ
jgi:predicted ribosomally synthesized peptide with SipW-like signal peptide